MKNRSRKTILAELQADAGNTPVKGSDIERSDTRLSRDEIISGLRSMAQGGEATRSAINDAYQARTAQRQNLRAERYNNLVKDYQALFDENKKLRTDKADLKTVSGLLSRAEELYKERTSETENSLKALQESLRSIQARNMVSWALPDSWERAIGKAEERAAKVQAGAAAIPGLTGDGKKWAGFGTRIQTESVPEPVETYTAENVGDYMNRAVYLLSLPEWTDEQKQEAKSIQRAITAPPMADSYLKRLGQEDSEEAAGKAKEASAIAEELGYRISPFAAAATALGGSFVRGTGLPSLAQAAGAALGIDSWVQEIDQFNQRVSRAASTGTAGKIASGIGGTIGGLAAYQSAAGLAGQAAGAIQGFSLLSPTMQGAAKTAITFMLTDAARGAGDVATGKTNVGEYAESVMESGLGGAAGSVASALVTSGIAQQLAKHNLQTPFMEFLRQLSGGTVFAAASTGTEYAFQDPEERPDAQAVAQQMATAFLFSVINSSISTVQTTRANRARIEQAVQQMQQDYQNMAQGAMSQEEMQRAAERMMQYSSDIRSALDQNYYAGQQDYIDQVRSALDVIDDYVANAAGRTSPGAEAPLLGAGSAGAESAAGGMIVSPAGGGGAEEAEAMAREIQAAVASGLEDANNLRSLEQSAPPAAAEPAQDLTARAEALYQEFGSTSVQPKTVEQTVEERADALYREFGGMQETSPEGSKQKPQSTAQEAVTQAAQTFQAEQREMTGAAKTGQGTKGAAQAATARNAAQMTAKTGKAGTSVRGTDVVKAVKIGDNDIVIQKTDGSTASINTLDQRGTALEVLQFAKEMPDYRDTMTVNGMMRDYEAYLGSSGGNRNIAERFYDNYVIAVAGGAEGESLADVLGVTTSRRMQTAMESGWRRGVEIAKGRRISMEMGSAGQAAMEKYGYLYPQMFSEFYRAGQQGATFQQAMDAAGVKSLGEIKKAEMKAAWKAGRKDGMEYEGNTLSDGSGEWETSMDSEEPVVGVEPGAEEADTSAAELGVEGGSIRKTVKVLQDRDLTPEMKTMRNAAKEAGVEVTFIRGHLEIQSDGETYKARGAHMGDRIIVKADDKKATFRQVYRHEWLHHQIDAGAVKLEEAIKTVKNAVGADIWEAQTPKYRQAYLGVYLNRRSDFANLVAEEMCADAYAGLFPGSDAVEIRGAEIAQKNSDRKGGTNYVNVKKGNLSTPTDDRASVNTPEANNGTVSYKINLQQGQAESQGEKLSIMEPESSAEYKQYMGRVGGRTPRSSSEYAEIQRRQEKLYDHMVKRQFELRRQMSEGTEKQPTRETVAAVAQEILKITGQNAMSRGMLSERIEQIAMNAARETNRMEAYRKAKEETDLLAADLVRGATGRTEKTTRDWDGIRAVFRSGGKPVKLFIDGANRMDLETEGGYEGMRKRLMGYAFLSSGGVPVGEFYKTLAERYPDYFPDTLTRQADQLIQIAKVLDRFRSIFKSPYEGELATATEYISNEILQKLYNNLTTSPGAEAYAEQHEDMLRAYYQQKIKELKANHQDQVEQMKREYAAKRQKERESQKTAREERELRTELLHMAQRLSRIKVGSQWKDEADYLIGQLDTISKRMTGCTIVGEYIGNISSEGIEVKEFKKNGKKLVNLVDLKRWVDTMLAENPNFRPDAATMKKLQRLDRTSIDDLTMGQVRNLLNAMSNLEHEIEYSNKLIRSEEKREITVLSSIVRSDIEASGGVTPASVEKFLSDYITTQGLSPIRFLRRITGYKDSDPLYRAALELQRGETKMLDFQRRAEERFRSFQENKSFMESLSGKKSEAIEITGRTDKGIKTLKITPDMRIAIYLHSRNDENINHAELGGMLIPDYDLLMRGKTKEAYEQGAVMYLTKRQMQQIANGMKPMERNYANAVWEYYNVFAKEELNAVSRDLIGYDRATVRNYYPIEVGQDYRMGDPTEIPGTPSAANPGNLKERTGAATTINLRGATETLMKSIDMNAKYIGLAIPVRNFGKLYGNTTWFVAYDNNDAGWMQEDEREKQTVVSSVQAVINRTWGSKAGNYIDKLLKDIQTQSYTEDVYAKGMDKIRSNYAGAVLTLNLSVAMKQAASYPTAAAVVGWKPLAQAMTNWKTADLDRIAKYTPLLWYRSKGYSTKELGDLAKGNKGLPKALNWIQAIDVATTQKLWKAAEYYVRDNQKGLTIGSDEYYKAVAEVYNRIILETQPNYTTMERPQALRSDSDMVKNMMMFKTQPMQNLNIAYDSIANLRAKERQLKAARDAAKNDPADAEQVKAAERAVKEAKRSVANGISALLVSGAVFSAMTLLWNLFRGNKKKYQNDDGDMTALSFLKGFGGDMLSSFAGMVPFGSDVYEVVWSAMTGDTYYGMEALTPSAISDFLETVVKVPDNFKDIVSVFQGEKSAVDVFWSVDQLAVAASKLLGIPVENVQNLMKAVSLNVMKTAMPAEEADYWYRYYTTKTSASKRRSKDYTDIYEAAKDGNTDGYKAMREKMEGWIWKENDSYQSGEISREEARERATETVNKAMQDRIKDEFLDGTLNENRARKLLTEIGGMDDDKAEESLKKWMYKEESGNSDASASSAERYYEFAEPAGINISVFDEAYTFKSNVEADKDKDGEPISGSAKQKVVDYILGLGLSDEQERALWNALKGTWSDKDTPWH